MVIELVVKHRSHVVMVGRSKIHHILWSDVALIPRF